MSPARRLAALGCLQLMFLLAVGGGCASVDGDHMGQEDEPLAPTDEELRARELARAAWNEEAFGQQDRVEPWASETELEWLVRLSPDRLPDSRREAYPIYVDAVGAIDWGIDCSIDIVALECRSDMCRIALAPGSLGCAGLSSYITTPDTLRGSAQLFYAERTHGPSDLVFWWLERPSTE